MPAAVIASAGELDERAADERGGWCRWRGSGWGMSCREYTKIGILRYQFRYI